ncbi:MAG: hypothetical protein M0Q48_00560 [Verrucomicrobia bacterium]|nr:hypothetical protein [Verrucomicrobiota bacterium]
MKKILWQGIPWVILVCLCFVFWIVKELMTIRDWPLSSGTIKIEKVSIGERNFILIDGEPMNYLAQVQSINVELDSSLNEVKVNRYRIFWCPFTEITVNNQFPILYSIDGWKPGKYSVVYGSETGDVLAGEFEIP